VLPGAVAVPVAPGLDRATAAADLEGDVVLASPLLGGEYDTVFVIVPVIVVTEGSGLGLSVGFVIGEVTAVTEPGPVFVDQMAGSVTGGQCGIQGVGGVAPVKIAKPDIPQVVQYVEDIFAAVAVSPEQPEGVVLVYPGNAFVARPGDIIWRRNTRDARFRSG